jgi:hypothetical protein
MYPKLLGSWVSQEIPFIVVRRLSIMEESIPSLFADDLQTFLLADYTYSDSTDIPAHFLELVVDFSITKLRIPFG